MSFASASLAARGLCLCGCEGADHRAVWRDDGFDSPTFLGTRCPVEAHGGHKFQRIEGFTASTAVSARYYHVLVAHESHGLRRACSSAHWYGVGRVRMSRRPEDASRGRLTLCSKCAKAVLL